MSTRLLLVALVAAILPLGGCVAGLAASAAGMAVEGAEGHPQSNALLRPNAKAACTRQAAAYGKVHIIDVEQHTVDKIIVWGTVDDGRQRRSFECGFTTSVSSFKLREIRGPVTGAGSVR